MKSLLRILLCGLFVLHSGCIFKPHSAAQTAHKAEVKAEKVKEQQKKDFEKAKKKDVKRRFEMQTPKTKERMKGTRKEAKRINDQNHDPFFKRILKIFKSKKYKK
jgi:hypothetical protein